MRNPKSPFVIWLDDEPNLIDAEIYDLDDHGFHTETFWSVTDAFEWFSINAQKLQEAAAIVVDAMMPSRLDLRFESPDGIPAGALFCRQLKTLNVWPTIASKVSLYTRLPRGRNFDLVSEFVKREGIELLHKSGSSRIAAELIRSGKIQAND